jgi:hypothetical protein
LGHRVAVSPIATPYTPGPSPGPIVPNIGIFTLIWSNAPVETNIVLTATATDDDGATNTSAPVHITVLPPRTPPTNRPPVISVVATVPVAISGTKCWTWPGLTNPVPTWNAWVGPKPIFRLFTNCGPQNAIFTVSRFGATNDDLEVDYNIGGAATNGVNYVDLPGSVTIPAGQRSAQVTVVPIDDGSTNRALTVIVRLAKTTNYVVGFPPGAGAIILDSDLPLPFAHWLDGNVFNLKASGPDGAWFHVEASIDLSTWSSICTNQVVNGSIDFVDPDADSANSRFYRVVPESGPPQ